jgi:hypothetical protein
MNTQLATLGVIAGAYLLGSVSFAVVVSKLLGLPDPHSYGSGNPGATNVLRTGNKTAAALTFAGDGSEAAGRVVAHNSSTGRASLATAERPRGLRGSPEPVFHRCRRQGVVGRRRHPHSRCRGNSGLRCSASGW